MPGCLAERGTDLGVEPLGLDPAARPRPGGLGMVGLAVDGDRVVAEPRVGGLLEGQ